jgi:PhnB protein
MATVNVYLTFDGNCAEAFNFYKTAFGGEFTYIGKYKDMPQNAENSQPMSEADGEKVMHVTLPISHETCLMGCDTGGEWAAYFKQGNNFSISINVNSKDEADRLFNTLSADGRVTMPMAKTFWSDYFGMFTDKFGINWMVDLGEK